MLSRRCALVTDAPMLSRLEFAFQTEGKLYIGMEFLAGGPLFYHLQQVSAARGREA